MLFRKFQEFESARKVLLWLHEQQITIPAARSRESPPPVCWQRPRYGRIVAILQNPLYAGVYAFYSMYGGGPVCDLGVHVLDGIHLMTGADFPASVTARGVGPQVEGFDTAERGVIVAEYPNGLLVSIAINGAAPSPHEISVLEGIDGRIEIEPRFARLRSAT